MQHTVHDFPIQNNLQLLTKEFLQLYKVENPTSRIVIFVLKSIKIYFGINSVVGSCGCKTRSGVKKPKCSSPTVKYRYMQVLRFNLNITAF